MLEVHRFYHRVPEVQFLQLLLAILDLLPRQGIDFFHLRGVLFPPLRYDGGIVAGLHGLHQILLSSLWPSLLPPFPSPISSIGLFVRIQLVKFSRCNLQLALSDVLLYGFHRHMM